MTVKRRINVAMLPSEAALSQAECAVVIDTLRATTTITALFDAGARNVTAMNDIETARLRAAQGGGVLAGEVGGLPPEGFDLGNSPVEARGAKVHGRDVVLFTSNGTKALCAAVAGVTVAGALTNASAVAEFAARYENVAIICAGNHGGLRFGMEDFAVAGALVALLSASGDWQLNDAANVSLQSANAGSGGWAQQVAQMIRRSEHAAATMALGLDGDIDYACQADSSSALPVVVDAGDGWVRLEDQRD